MPARTHETTRLLCASAFLSGASFRDTVLKRYKERHQAKAPEIGVDLELVAQVCKAADRRAVTYALIFAALPLLALIVYATIVLEVATILGVILILAAGILYFVKTYQERYSLILPFLRQSFDPGQTAQKYPPYGPGISQTTAAGDEQNLVVYSGFLPFVGSGIDFGGWSFAVSTIKGSDDLTATGAPVPFGTLDLYTEIEAGLDSMGIPEVKGQDFYFVNGMDIRSDRQILPDEFGRPRPKIQPETAAAYKDNSDPRIRHYRWIRVEDWGGEVVMSMFLRCTQRGSNLFVEMKRFLLTPVAQKYKLADKVSPPSAGIVIGWLLMSLIIGPLYVIYSVLFLVVRLLAGVEHLFGSQERKLRQEIRNNPLYNYGVDKSLRAEFSSGEYHHYFQKVDTDFYGKVLERQILDSIVSFLDEHHIDTSEIKDRKNAILNNGIIVQGGDVKAESLAVGAGAQALKTGINTIKKVAKGAEA